MSMPFRFSSMALLAALGASAGFATAVSGLPAEQGQGNVRFVTGGVGFDEAEALRQAASHYPLAIELAAKPVPQESYPRCPTCELTFATSRGSR